ncbi:MAG: ABC transporter permease [Anaerolineae bacterium]|nr:ABC transporter permease [Anaerolineae bacterium]MDQ7037123.1 ABC transporter permease [Anaerolineae bacterium]
MPKIARLLLLTLSLMAWLLLAVPIVALVWRLVASGNWQNLPQAEIIISATWLSLKTTFASVLLMIVFGTPLAYVLARWRFTGRRLVRVITELPIVLPPAIAGLALLLTFGRRGIFGTALSAVGLNIPFTALAVIIAQTFVASPFYIRAAQVGFADVSDELENAARVDGASEIRVFWHITLPLALRALSAGLVLAWARAMGEFGATILFAGSLQGRTQTMTLLVYDVFQRDLDTAIWTGLILVAVALITLMLSQWLAREDDL